MTYQIEILNPKAEKLLNILADLKLISIVKDSNDPFLAIVKKLRKRAATIKSPTFEEITDEVEKVRHNRYVNNKKL